MKIPNKYFHDRVVLFLISFNSFFAALTILWNLSRIGSSSSDLFIIQCRYCSETFPQLISGGSQEFIAFVLFVLIVLVSNIVLSMRIYEEKRRYAIGILALTTVLIIFALVVSNALLALS